MFITLEGTEGSGKSLQQRRLVERLQRHGLATLATHEPGGSPLSDQLRRLVLLREDLHVSPRAEALMMNASRAQLVEEVIGPALARGEVVVCDRFADSTLAYQGGGRGLDLAALGSVISFATAGLTPTMTMLLDLPVEVGLARKRSAGDWNRFDAETVAFHARVRAAYHDLASAVPERWYCIDALRSPEAVAEDIWRHVAARLGL